MAMIRKGRLSVFSFLAAFLCIFLFSHNVQAFKKGGVLRIGFGMTAVKLDPHASAGSGDVYIMAHIYERLLSFKLDEKTRKPIAVPSLAEKWEVSPDKMSWTFHLRKDVKFTDGTPFNAEAVKFNIERLLGPPPQPNARNYTFLIKNVEAIDDYTARVNLKVPAVPVESFFVQSYIGMVSPTAAKKWGDKLGMHPVGTGPYKLKEWVHGEKVVLEANMEHWKGRPNLDRIEFRFVPESSSRMNMLKTGQVDLSFNLDVPDLEKVKKEGKFDVIEWPTTELLYLALNNLAKPTNETAVRRAIKLAIDRKGIVEKILQGHATLANTYISPICMGSIPSDPMIFDPEKAKSILEKAGWIDTNNDGIREKNGQKLHLKIRYPTGRYPMCDEMVAVIQNQLANVGFECIPEKMGFGAWITALVQPPDKSTGDAFIVSWPSKEDPQWALFAMQPYSPLSYYQNKAVANLSKAQLVEWDPQKRMEILKKIQEIAEKEAFGVNMFFMNYNIVKKKNVKIEPTYVPVSDTFNVYNAWIE